MKKLLLLWFLALCLNAQQHFRTELRIRMEGGKVLADLVSLEDYEIQAIQFGFHHNSDHVSFEKINIGSLPEISNLASNQVCPKYVRISWNEKTGKTLLIHKDDILFTLVFVENLPTNHYICMMESQTPQKSGCKYFYREVIDKNGNAIPVDDVCIDYKIENGQAIVLSSEKINPDDINVYYQPAANNIVFDLNKSSSSYEACLYTIDGKHMSTIILPSHSITNVSADEINNGIVYYTITDRNSRKNVHSAKLIVH